jgi:hypothetical protein
VVGLVGLGAPVAGATSSPRTLDVGLATSSTGPSGSWAVLPMGHLKDRLNTFWQLLHRPLGAATWHDVTSFGVATNGGLVMATGESLLVGILPSHLLSFSAIASTSTSGATWTPAPPLPALAAQTSALSANANGRRLALVQSGQTRHVLLATSASASWRPLVTQSQLAATSGGQVCDLKTLTSVLASSSDVVGGSCRHPGVVGLFTRVTGTWRLAVQHVPSRLRHDTISVLGLFSSSSELALLAASSATSTSLAIARLDASSRRWLVTPGPLLARGSVVSSVGPSASGLFVLSTYRGASQLQVSDGADAWHSSSLPTGTATVSYAPGGQVQALAVDQSVLTVFDLTSTHAWRKVQVVNVAIPYGSSG